jgi:acetolactate synthase, small subunit
MDEQLFTISVFTENQVGLLSRLCTIFTRRGLSIDSITASASSMPGIHKITVTCMSNRRAMEKVVQQIEKCIEVLRAFLYTDDEIIHQEIALYKVPTERLLDLKDLETVIRRYNARILEITRDYTIIEKSGHSDETEQLYELLKRYDIRQFARSGRVCVTKSPTEHLNYFLEEQERRRTKTEES